MASRTPWETPKTWSEKEIWELADLACQLINKGEQKKAVDYMWDAVITGLPSLAKSDKKTHTELKHVQANRASSLLIALSHVRNSNDTPQINDEFLANLAEEFSLNTGTTIRYMPGSSHEQTLAYGPAHEV